MSRFQKYYVSEEKILDECNLPYVENFPRNVKLPKYIFKSLEEFGNTVISNKLLKQYGWNGIQWHCDRKGYKVTLTMSCFDNCIVEVFGSHGRY